MDETKRRRGAKGYKSIQAFIREDVYARFRAACALRDLDISVGVEDLMKRFADEQGIPANAPKPHKPAKR